jgi:hypothetical protein
MAADSLSPSGGEGRVRGRVLSWGGMLNQALDPRARTAGL